MKHAFIDRYSHLQSPVHRLDARLKFILALLAIAVLVSEPPGKLMPFAFYGAIVLVVLILSRLPVRFFLKRLLILAPFFGMAALFYPLSYWLAGTGLGEDGMQKAVLVALSIFFKALLSVSFLILLISTVKFHDLLAGLRKLRMPKLIGILSALMYRYIFILGRNLTNQYGQKQPHTRKPENEPFHRVWQPNGNDFPAQLGKGPYGI